MKEDSTKSGEKTSGAKGIILDTVTYLKSDPTAFPPLIETIEQDYVSNAAVPVFQYTILLLICLMSFMIRLFAVVRWESVIHEYDPYFNYRTTKYLANEGPVNFLNWFDDRSCLTCVVTFLLTKEVVRRSSTALLAAAFVGVVPSYISRSVGGSYDNEGVAIFALIFVFYLWVKSVNTGSMAYAAVTAVAYFYMVSAWGGYIFIINIIPLYVLILTVAGRYSRRLYVAYTTYYILGNLMAMQVPFVGFNVLLQAECASSHGVFIMINAFALMICIALLSGKVQFTGRALSLLDPTYAKKYIPIIASVSEHQPTTWTSFFFDLHILVPFSPAGVYFLFENPTDSKIFIILYGTISWYFAGVMVRLMLTLAPIACILASISVSAILRRFMAHIKYKVHLLSDDKNLRNSVKTPKSEIPFRMLCMYSMHVTYVASEAYSSPSIVLASRRADGTRVIMDDYREAYYWLRHNTHPDAKVLAWWDYGYQMASMSNRTTLVDNVRFHFNFDFFFFFIKIFLDVDYVLVVFGGKTGYQSDDINKFLWMVRIAQGVYDDEKYYNSKGRFAIDHTATKQFLRSLIYKTSYYRFSELITDYSKPNGFDLVRNMEVGDKHIQLEHIEEAFTSQNWMVRIYRVKKGHEWNRVQTSRIAAAKANNSGFTSHRSKYIGCFTSENSFSEDKIYAGGSTGARFKLAKHHAVTNDKKYFAIARAYSDGHSFAFNKLLTKLDREGGSCERPCLDETKRRCGCIDDFCDEATPEGETNNRRWSVYKVLPPAAGTGKDGVGKGEERRGGMTSRADHNAAYEKLGKALKNSKDIYEYLQQAGYDEATIETYRNQLKDGAVAAGMTTKEYEKAYFERYKERYSEYSMNGKASPGGQSNRYEERMSALDKAKDLYEYLKLAGYDDDTIAGYREKIQQAAEMSGMSEEEYSQQYMKRLAEQRGYHSRDVNPYDDGE
eukprot:GSMAST32.ASY1.ANO1.928.1 assembled CDS